MVAAIGALLLAPLQAQISSLGNLPSSLIPPDYVGWNGATTIPLEVRHNGNQPIEWYTDSIRRMHLTETLTGQTVNGYTGLNLSGHLGIGAFADPNVANPFTLLHLDLGGDENTGYRSWMKAGTYITDHSDMMYVGTKPRPGGSDRNDAVINWADNLEAQSLYGPDMLRF